LGHTHHHKLGHVSKRSTVFPPIKADDDDLITDESPAEGASDAEVKPSPQDKDMLTDDSPAAVEKAKSEEVVAGKLAAKAGSADAASVSVEKAAVKAKKVEKVEKTESEKVEKAAVKMVEKAGVKKVKKAAAKKTDAGKAKKVEAKKAKTESESEAESESDDDLSAVSGAGSEDGEPDIHDQALASNSDADFITDDSSEPETYQSENDHPLPAFDPKAYKPTAAAGKTGDYLKDSNSDGGAWDTSLEYDQTRMKLGGERQDVAKSELRVEYAKDQAVSAKEDLTGAEAKVEKSGVALDHKREEVGVARDAVKELVDENERAKTELKEAKIDLTAAQAKVSKARKRVSAGWRGVWAARRKMHMEELRTGKIGKLNRLKNEFEDMENKHKKNVEEEKAKSATLTTKYKQILERKTELVKEKNEVKAAQAKLDNLSGRLNTYGSSDANPWNGQRGGAVGQAEVYDHSYGSSFSCRVFGVFC